MNVYIRYQAIGTEKMEINRKQEDMALYVYNNPGCWLKYGGMQTYFHKEKQWHPNTIKKYYKQLIDSGHIKIIDNKLYFNGEFIELYPKIKEEIHKKEIEEKKRLLSEQENLKRKRELNSLFFNDDIISAKLRNLTQIEVKPTEFPILPKEFREIFFEFIHSLLIECFFNNPYNWHIIKKSEDLDFTITIKAHWSRDKVIFNRLEKNRDQCIKDGILYAFGRSIFQSWLDKESRNTILKGKTVEDLYNIGWGIEWRRKNQEEQKKYFKEEKDHCRTLIKDNLVLVESVHNYIQKLKSIYPKHTKIPHHGFDQFTLEDFEKSFDYETRKESLTKLENLLIDDSIIAKFKYNFVEWCPLIKKPRLNTRKQDYKFGSWQTLLERLQGDTLSNWAYMLGDVKDRFNMQDS